MIGIAICRQQCSQSTQPDKAPSKFHHLNLCMADWRLPFSTLENHFPWQKERPEPFDIFLARVGELREAARLNIIKKQEKSKRLVDQRRRIVQDLRPGELVLVRIKLKKKNKTKKFLPKYVGPFQVVKKICPTTYLVEDLLAKRKKKRFRWFNVHVVQIRMFHPREDVEWDDWPDEPDENAVSATTSRKCDSCTTRPSRTSTNRSAGSCRNSSPSNKIKIRKNSNPPEKI